jgi:PAS domain S-box-containing protein
MLAAKAGADNILQSVIAVLHLQDATLMHVLDDVPAPLYITDSEGYVTYFNPSCVSFAGRTPLTGKDRWCVTWKLYTDAGAFLPHDQCPMADALRTKREVRGLTAVAERPDGTRVKFMPFPTPLFSDEGEFLGAVNMLIDITEKQQADELRVQAARCHRLAVGCGDSQAHKALERMAAEYEIKASALDLLAHH